MCVTLTLPDDVWLLQANRWHTPTERMGLKAVNNSIVSSEYLHEVWFAMKITSSISRSTLPILSCHGAIPNFATEKEQKRNFLDFNDVTLVVVDIKSERFVKSTCLQQDLFDMTMVTIMFDTKTSESESFIDRSIEGIINIMMEFHHF